VSVVPDFGITAAVNDSKAVVAVRGELDVSTAPRLKETLGQLIDKGVRDLTLDLTDLVFIDSNGLHALVASLKRLRERDGTLRLRAPRPNVRKVLEIVGLTEVVPID
jgi:anti-sigma B factor antagonist